MPNLLIPVQTLHGCIAGRASPSDVWQIANIKHIPTAAILYVCCCCIIIDPYTRGSGSIPMSITITLAAAFVSSPPFRNMPAAAASSIPATLLCIYWCDK